MEERKSQMQLWTDRCDSCSQSSPNSIKHVTLLLSLCTSTQFSLSPPPPPSVVHHDSKVWKGGEQSGVYVCEGGEV